MLVRNIEWAGAWVGAVYSRGCYTGTTTIAISDGDTDTIRRRRRERWSDRDLRCDGWRRRDCDEPGPARAHASSAARKGEFHHPPSRREEGGVGPLVNQTTRLLLLSFLILSFQNISRRVKPLGTRFLPVSLLLLHVQHLSHLNLWLKESPRMFHFQKSRVPYNTIEPFKCSKLVAWFQGPAGNSTHLRAENYTLKEEPLSITDLSRALELVGSYF